MSEEIKATEERHLDFIRQKINDELAAGKFKRVVTRFPPEPNGYLHIGHAKALCLDFGLAEEYPNAECHLRFDDTNPSKEDDEYVEAIKEDIHWLGFDWGPHLYFASDYFEKMYEWAIEMIEKGKAYVDDSAPDEIRQMRGTLTEPGVESPYRNRSVEENLDLFQRMRAGEFPDGSKVLRAKIDMKSQNINFRDPVMYRIVRKDHHRQGSKWCIYPMYDWAHGLEDSIEGITNSLCSLEFENHRPLYNWFLDQLDNVHHPEQTEFARLNLTGTVMSKRKLRTLVDQGYVTGWDDPRMPTLSGMRRRGYPPAAIREFIKRVGIAKVDSVVDFALLEHCVRDELNRTAQRLMLVQDPLKVVLTNYPEGQTETLTAINNPEDESAGTREVPFGRELFIEREDFMEDPPNKFFRLAPGREVRLRYAYFITCQEVVKDAQGNITELRCTYDPATRGGESPDGRKVKGTIHWVAAHSAVKVTLNNFSALFKVDDPENVPEGQDFTVNVNPDSLSVNENALAEPAVANVKPLTPVQFERIGYFTPDRTSTPEHPVYNRTATLKDSWGKIQKKQ